jgi:hypothetical protein
MKYVFLTIILSAVSCASNPFKKDNEAQVPTRGSEELTLKLEAYQLKAAEELDEYDMVSLDNSIGDSALFSCIGMASGLVLLDLDLIITKEGKPLRHPQISPKVAKTPVSRDMVVGLLWCILAMYEEPMGKLQAKYAIERLIKYVRANNGFICSSKDRKDYEMSNEDWLGRCRMSPSLAKDMYRVAKHIGISCDKICKSAMEIGINIPSTETGFRRHLTVLNTLRNGIIEGAINDNSLKGVLKEAKDSNPHNALYQAAYHTFTDGDQEDAIALLLDEGHWPSNRLPTTENHCVAYIYQREETSDDWRPCPDEKTKSGYGVDFIFAASLALGRIPGQGGIKLTGGI